MSITPKKEEEFSRLDRDCFRVLEVDGRFDGEAIRSVLSRRAAACIFRNVLSEEHCNCIAANFWSTNGLEERGDAASGWEVGAYHFNKPLETYFRLVEASREDLSEVIRGAEGLLESVRGAIREATESLGGSFGLAEHHGRKSGDFVAKSWADGKDFVLRPHEDGTQLGDEKQKGFEIQEAYGKVCGVNLYIRTPKPGTRVRMWNIHPSEEAQKNLGVKMMGYPYSLDHLDQFDSLDYEVRQSDVYILNAHLVHSLLRDENAGGQRRLTLSFFMGVIAEDFTTVWWT